MKKTLYKFFVILPIGLILVTVVLVVSFVLIFKDFYLRNYYEITSYIQVNKSNAELQAVIEDENLEVGNGDTVLVYWDANKLSLKATISDLIDNGDSVNVTLLVNESDIKYLSEIDKKELATLRIFTENVSIWKKIFM